MIWIKNRDDTTDWIVGQKDLDGGNEPWTHYLKLNTYDPEGDYDYFVDKAPTAHSFEVTTGAVNDTNKSYLALLFKSITGISKIGSYAGDTSNPVTVTTGFQPRFLMIKNLTWAYGGWVVFDTLRALGGSNDYLLYINSTQAQQTNQDFGSISSTGFTVGTGDFAVNGSGHTYIYYALA